MKKSESFKRFLARKRWRDCESVLFEKKWAEIVKNHMENFFSRKIPLTCEVKRNLFCNITRRVIRLAFRNTSMIQITKGEN